MLFSISSPSLGSKNQSGKLITPAWWPGVAPPRRSLKNSSVSKFFTFFRIAFHAYYESGFNFDEEEEIMSRSEKEHAKSRR
jgi:hypothetical protein